MSWTGGSGPTNVASGGPGGVGDRYMHWSSTSGVGAGSRLGAFNGAQWAGDYSAASVEAVSLWLQNPSATNVEMRAVLFSPTGARWTSTNSFPLAAGTGWTQHTFSLKAVDMTLVLGTTPHATLMTNVSQLMFRHDGGTPDPTGEAITAQLNLDNITAVPEPGTMVALGFGVLALLRRRRK